MKKWLFFLAKSKNFKDNDFGLITFFDCLHNMGDTVSAACHAKDALNADGFCMIVEPFANDQRQENLNPVGKAFYAFSTMICIPASLGQEVGSGLGARAGYKRLKSVLKSGGFRHIKKSPETPFNLTIEAR